MVTDYESDLLFWVDTKQHVVVSSDLNGRKRSILLTSSNYLRHAVAITVFEVLSTRHLLFISSGSTVMISSAVL